MTKTPTINRRSWLALWLQRRRRARGLPNAPVIVSGNYAWFGSGDDAYCNVTLGFTFDAGANPVALIEVWSSLYAADYILEQTVPSNSGVVVIDHAALVESTFDYKLRYVNGARIGQFSQPWTVDIFAI